MSLVVSKQKANKIQSKYCAHIQIVEKVTDEKSGEDWGLIMEVDF